MARKTTFEEDDGMFDIDFWQMQGAEAIFAATWQMVLDVSLIKGIKKDEREHRLQRSIARLKQNPL